LLTSLFLRTGFMTNSSVPWLDPFSRNTVYSSEVIIWHETLMGSESTFRFEETIRKFSSATSFSPLSTSNLSTSSLFPEI
jgi:hypothetical protein